MASSWCLAAPRFRPGRSSELVSAKPLRILFVSAEVAPFAKTGGLGDVGAALPRALAAAGHDVRVFLPRYSSVKLAGREAHAVDFLRDVPIALGRRTVPFTAITTALPHSDLPIYLVDCPPLYDRPGIYTSDEDEPLRFAFLALSALESCQRMGWSPEIVHVHDWHVALLPLYMRRRYGWDDLFKRSRTLLTIHNVGYQGLFWANLVDSLGLGEDRRLLHQEDLAAGRINFLKTGILYADWVSTVSPTHAREIQTPEYGFGLDEMLSARSDHLTGILNGVDYDEWNPETDPLIPFHYSRDDLGGKAENKSSLLTTLNLPVDSKRPLLGLVSRLVYQKGIDLLTEVLPGYLAQRDVTLVVLGSGEPRYESFFEGLQRAFPAKMVYHRGFHNELAHRIEAASDMFLMPSLYEPCGLNQMYSLRYGTVPIVRKTGGLADSVKLWDPDSGAGTGFVFDHPTREGLAWALDTAVRIYRDEDAWTRIVRNGMAEDFSWSRQCGEYVDLYRHLLNQ